MIFFLKPGEEDAFLDVGCVNGLIGYIWPINLLPWRLHKPQQALTMLHNNTCDSSVINEGTYKGRSTVWASC